MLFVIGELSGDVYKHFNSIGEKTGLEANQEYCIAHSIVNDEGKTPVFKECHRSVKAKTIDEARKIAAQTSRETRKEDCELNCPSNFKCEMWHRLYGEQEVNI